MASNVVRRVPKIDDLTLYNVLSDISALFSDKSLPCTISPIPGIQIRLEEIDDTSLLAGRYSFEQANAHANFANEATFSLHFQRTITEGSNQVGSARFDEFKLTFGRDAGVWQNRRELVEQVLEVLGRLNIASPPGDTSGADDLQELIVGFSNSHRQMMGALNQQIVAVEEARREREEAALAAEDKRLEEHRRALEELESERAKLQLQSYKAERRRILQQMTDDKAASLRKALAPKGAVYSRWGVFFAAILLSLVSAVFAYQSIDQLSQIESAVEILQNRLAEDSVIQPTSIVASIAPTNWYLIGRSILSSIVAIGSLVYAASWLRSFYISEVNAAREIDRFNYDLVRASWIIETILEVKHEHAGEVPQEWVEGVTRGLFDSKGRSNQLDDRAEALRALMNFTASASFGPDGPKFDLGRRDTRKLAGSTGAAKPE